MIYEIPIYFVQIDNGIDMINGLTGKLSCKHYPSTNNTKPNVYAKDDIKFIANSIIFGIPFMSILIAIMV